MSDSKKPFYKKGWFWVASVFALGGIFTAIDVSNSANVSTNSEPLLSVASEPFLSTASEAPFSEVDSSKIYTIDEFCSFFESDDDFARNHGDVVFTISGTIDNKLYSSVEFKSSFDSEKWGTDYKISCEFNDKEAIKEINDGATATISGGLFSLATSGIVLEDCTVVSFENPKESISEIETDLADKIWGAEEPKSTETTIVTEQVTERTAEVSSVVNPVSEAEQSATWETVGNKKAEKTYILNTSTMKIHKPSCSSVEKIKPENYAETNDYDVAVSQGYEPCGNCHPF